MASPTPVELQILLCLSENPNHGYGIKQETERRTDGEIRLGPGTLYEAIQRLETAGFVSETTLPEHERSGRRKRMYELTPLGRRIMETELSRLDHIVQYARDRKLLPDSK